MIRAAMRARLMLVQDEGGDVFGYFDLLPAVIGARMRGDHRLAVKDAYLLGARDDG